MDFFKALFVIFLFFNQLQAQNLLKKGEWTGSLKLNQSDVLEFSFFVDAEGFLTIRNDEERIKVTDIRYSDSGFVMIQMPVFSTYFKVQNYGNKLSGYWVNPEKKDYKIPFDAKYKGKKNQSVKKSKSAFNLAGKWEVTFSPGKASSYKAVGLFKQEKNKLGGTFLTETGDYRFLEGQIKNNKMTLSCFDGAHAFLFKASVQNDSLSDGIFFSGTHWNEPWTAVRNDSFKLRNADSLTFLKAGYDKLEFRFVDENGDSISLNDKKFNNKAIIVQIMGSWCPNCMDETVFLVELYKKYQKEGLEIIAIDYEIRNDFEVFKKNIKKLRDDLGVSYTCLFGGTSKKSESQKTLPMLNGISSYPTTIYIDKNGNIQKIQTGFNGPGTGIMYSKYRIETIELLENNLLKSRK
jgi:thiol-disulfide isomerase/thioredoxin